LYEEWEELIQIFKPLLQLRIPCFIGSNDDGATYRIVTFCDASASSYAAAVYLRVLNKDSIQVNLLFSKMRLAPCGFRKKKPYLRQLSLPRLELLAVVIGTRVTMFVSNELKVCVSKKMIFTDSQCVLHWLKSNKPLLPSFVQNQVNEIHQENYEKFGYVLSEENLADFATRGLTVPEIKELNLWWHGPSWLVSMELIGLLETYQMFHQKSLRRWLVRLRYNLRLLMLLRTRLLKFLYLCVRLGKRSIHLYVSCLE